MALRSTVKSCLVLWTLCVGNDEVKSAIYHDVRRFVLKGGEDFVKARIRLDSRYFPNADVLKQRFGKFFNLMYVASNEAGRVVAHFTLYNIVSWHMVLAEAGGKHGKKIGLASNPLDPAVRSDSVADELPIDFTWLDSPDYSDNFIRARERVDNVMRHYVETAGANEQKRIIESVIKNNGLRENDPITDRALINKISREIAERINSHAFALPHEQKLTPEQIAALLDSSQR